MNQLQRLMVLAPFWQHRAEFYRDVAASIDARELFRDFVEGEWRIASNPRTANKQKAAVLAHMRRLMEDGISSMEEVLERTMPAGDAMGLAVIAQAQDKAAALRFVAGNVEEQSAMGKVVSAAVASPVILLPIALVFAAVMTGYVIPAFEKGASPEVWVGFAGFVRSAAHIFSTFALPIFALVLIFFIWFSLIGLSTITAMWRYQAESAVGLSRIPWLLLGPMRPMLSLYRDIQSARMLANLATLLQAGRGVQDALAELARHTNPWMRKHLLWVLEHMQLNPGDNVAAFSQGVLSGSILSRLHTKVRRDAGADFARVLVEIGTAGQSQAREDVARYAKQINLFLLVGVFGVILFFYIGQNFIVYRIKDFTSPQSIELRKKKQQQPAQAQPVSQDSASPEVRSAFSIFPPPSASQQES